ncbi:SIMPL domain-containing protein [Tautonia plasticadhaerens]|uniref:26 kDa periplasmic immunogenic protein n=1 Tax=Tautonia plasticadhaerens TaxID=2527974 RepID=A0A518H2I4_9BACT|nr:SIMPL domain-containing protein [Tautonia plasticadhaerens]QDV35030.1 26 kDa periplasmic immunogenic protein precursor [Tautonia plasticadhaerens]
MHSETTIPAMAMAFALLGMTLAASAQEDGMSDRRTLSVSGQGKISAAPDVADINVGVVAEAQTAREALSQGNQAMASLTEQLKGRGVAAKDVQTTNVNLSPRYAQPPRPQPGQAQQGQEGFTPRIIGYSVTNSVRVTVRDLAKLGELLDAVVTAGANQMNGIGFRVEQSEKLLDEARKRAVADARRKAEQLCGELGMVLGAPIQVTENSGFAPPPPQPMMGRAMMMAAESVPVSPGEQELTVSVGVLFEMTRPE